MTEERMSISPDALAQLFAAQLPGRPDQAVALAVSGGSDSVAMMVLFADWLRQQGGDGNRHTVLTVNHRLRAQAAAEARAVAEHAAARAARYRLMGDYMAAHGLRTLLVAHTRDDQAETLLMRLARGSGLDGLAAMAPATTVRRRAGG